MYNYKMNKVYCIINIIRFNMARKKPLKGQLSEKINLNNDKND